MYETLVVPHVRFGLKLLKEITRQEPDRNIVVSPMSVALAMAMVYNGAAGDTRKAMARVLELEGISLDAINAAYTALLEKLDVLDSKISLTMTNKLEIGAGLPIKPAFLQTVSKYYRAEVVDNDALEDAINLVNTLHFKGQWADPFDGTRRRGHPFTLPNGEKQRCSMMSSPTQEWAYYQHDRFQLVRLPYGEGRASMYVLLPGENSSLSEFLQELLTPNHWTNWLAKLADTEGEVALPRFEVDYSIQLNDVFKTMGMGVAFDPEKANFEALCAANAFIYQVGHQARIEVDEEGTEASAETIVEIVLGGFSTEDEVFQMVVDRPFFYVIQDDLTGIPLLLGLTVDPGTFTSATQEQGEHEALRDALDLMVISMKGGLSFEAAMGRVYEEWDNEVALAFGRTLMERQLGRPRSDSLKQLAERMDKPDLTEFVHAIIKADEANESLLEVVSAHAQRLHAKYPKQ